MLFYHHKGDRLRTGHMRQTLNRRIGTPTPTLWNGFVIFNRETSYTVLVSQPDTQWIVEGKTSNGALRIQYDFEQISENRVLFKRTLSFKVEGHLRVMSYFLVKNMKKTSVIALDNLKKKLSDA